jgi:hypothetical protein
MCASIFAYRELCSSNSSHRNRTSRITVNFDGSGECVLPRFLPDVKDVTPISVAFVIDEMHDSPSIHRRLWLQTSLRRALESNLCAFG